MTPKIPLTREVVLIGGGHTHALFLRSWGMNPLPGVHLTLINPGPTAPYTGMLPGFIAGHYQRNELDIDLVRLARFAGVRLILDKAVAIDRGAKRIQLAQRRALSYDIAAIDIGITADIPTLPGFAEYGVPAKPLGVLSQKWPDFLEQFPTDKPARLSIIGGGVAGVELAMAMAHALQSQGITPDITVFDRGEILSDVSQRARQKLLQHLATYSISTRAHTTIRKVTADSVILASGETVTSDFTLSAAGARPYEWLADTGLTLENGYISVDATLRSSDTAIYAVGDCAHLSHAPRPKAGVFAVREAPVLLHNIRADLSGHKRQTFQPQRDYLKLISLGDRSALAEKMGIVLDGKQLWQWKDHIDQKFMTQFRNYPLMRSHALPKEIALGVRESLDVGKPLCGGCGAKVGKGTLQRVLKALPQVKRHDVVSLPGDDAAILRYGEQFQVVTTDHLRAFTHDPALHAHVAAIHALGDIWAMGAQPQTVLATIILPVMSAELQEHWLAEIMAVAGEVFAAQGAAIVGGHTSLGDELTIGFTITGLCESLPIQLSGAQAGDALLLVKPLGTGTLLAAEMAMAACGNDVAVAWRSMTQDQAAAAAILREAHAMTDVTGFGLIGHLLGMCEASGCAARLNLADIPLLPGAEALAEQGIRSTLYQDNVQATEAFMNFIGSQSSAKAALLFDPQTAGGLLAAVSAEQALTYLQQLQAAGYQAACIGAMEAGEPMITVAP